MSDPREVRPPVDPLDDVAWARVERELWARLDSGATAPGRATPRRAWLRPALIGAAVAGVAAAAVVAIVRPAEPSATVRADRAVDARPESTTSRIVTDAAPTSITFDDVHVAALADTAVVFDRDPHAPSALVERGGAWFTVAPRGPRPQFTVRAGDAAIAVIGTRFRVARADEHIEVEVDHGRVGVTFRGQTLVVADRELWSSETPTRVVALEPAPPAPPVVPPTPAVKPPVKVTPPPRKSPSLDASERDRTRFAELTTREASDPTGALAGYLELATHTTPWAELAQFAAARLAVDRGDPRAAALLQTYLRRFPRGANADDARQLADHLQGAR